MKFTVKLWTRKLYWYFNSWNRPSTQSKCYRNGQVAINPRFNKLITALRTAVENWEVSRQQLTKVNYYTQKSVVLTWLWFIKLWCMYQRVKRWTSQCWGGRGILHKHQTPYTQQVLDHSHNGLISVKRRILFSALWSEISLYFLFKTLLLLPIELTDK